MKPGSIWCGERLLVPDAACTQWLGERLAGLLGRRSLAVGRGLLIAPCAAVHTVAMRFALDLVFIDRDWRVVRTAAAVPPGRLAVWGGPGAYRTLEVQAGWLELTALDGRTLRWAPRGNT